MLRFALLSITFAACSGSNGNSITAEVRGTDIVVKVTCTEATGFTLLDRELRCFDGKTTEHRIPASAVGAGKHTLQTIINTHTYKISIDVPSAAVVDEPRLTIAQCANGYDAKLVIMTGDRAAEPLTCASTTSLELVIDATPRAKLTIGTQQFEIPATGIAKVTVETNEALSAAPVYKVSTTEKTKQALTLPWKLAVNGKSIEGTLAHDTEVTARAYGQYVAALGKGRIKQKAVASTPLVAATDDNDEIFVSSTNTKATLADITHVAVVTAQGPYERVGTCDYYEADADGKVRNQTKKPFPREGRRTTVSLLSLADGKPVATTEFGADKAPCPDVATKASAIQADIGAVAIWEWARSAVPQAPKASTKARRKR